MFNLTSNDSGIAERLDEAAASPEQRLEEDARACALFFAIIDKSPRATAQAYPPVWIAARPRRRRKPVD